MKEKLKKIWKDSVFSKLIAEVIKWLWIIWVSPILIAIWSFFKALISEIDLQSAWTQTFLFVKSTANKTINFNLLTLIGFVVAYFLVTYLLRRFLSSRKSYKIKNYNNDKFWNAIIKWKWEKKDGQLRLVYDDYEKICPNCRHNLETENQAGSYFLECKNCGFKSGQFHYEQPSNVMILMPMSTFYFHNALTSNVDAELRHKGLK